jgi:hypothetical protein
MDERSFYNKVFDYILTICNSESKTLDGINYFAQPNYFYSKDGSSFESNTLEYISKNSCKNMYQFLPTECQSSFFLDFINEWVYEGTHKKIIEFDTNLEKLDCNFYFVYGSDNPKLYQDFLKDINLKRFKIIYWPTWLVEHTYIQLRRDFINERKLDCKVYDLEIEKDFEKLYLNMNLRPRIHRRIMIDKLYNSNLFDCGFTSWNQLYTEGVGNDIIKDDSFYKDFIYWNEEILNLDDISNKNKNFVGEFSDRILTPKALFNLAGETSMDVPYITEKTFRCIFLKQPFIAFGSTNQNKELLKYGFKLYDNVLDYSFDDEEDVFKRYDLIIEQLIKLKNKDYNELYDLMEPTLEYNKQLIHKITHGSNHIPNEILNIYENRN